MVFSQKLVDWWDVLLLYLIPVGGGIPAGVVLAKNRGLEWPIMMLLYFISDVILACVFDPLTWFFVWLGKKVLWLGRFNQLLKASTERSVARYKHYTNPFYLIMVSFGVDPMTGRAAALAVGHGFLTGWAIAIAGDMIFFTVIMASTLWLNSLLGDGTWAVMMIMLFMFFGPALVRRVRSAFVRSTKS